MKKLEAFCPACGKLKVDKFGKVIHPEQDKLYKELLTHGFEIEYTDCPNEAKERKKGKEE